MSKSTIDIDRRGGHTSSIRFIALGMVVASDKVCRRNEEQKKAHCESLRLQPVPLSRPWSIHHHERRQSEMNDE